MAPLIDRMLRAAKLDVHLYEEVEADTTLTREALLVVVIVAVASGIGSLDAGFFGLLLGIIGAVIGWAVWAWIIYFVGTRILPVPETHADWGQVARGTGYAQAPGVLHVFGFIPGLGALISFVAAIWQIITMVTAVRQALDYQSTWRAVGVVLIGFIPYLLFNLIFLGIFLAAE